MRAIELDFLRRRKTNLLGLALLAAGCLLALGATDWYQQVTTGLAEQSDALRQIEGPARPAAAADPRVAKEHGELLAAARTVLNQLTVPWDALFQALESVDEPDAAVLALSPDAEKRQIKILAEAKNFAAMVSYHRKLAQHPLFTDVALADHEVMEQDPDRPVRFNLTGTWKALPDAAQ
jgi:Tfp pilus assembly protein PilN